MTYLVKRVKYFNLNLFILYRVCVEFADHVKNY